MNKQSPQKGNWYNRQAPIQQPQAGAPRMKDLDSFTEGTGQGSFDFLPLMAAEEGLASLEYQ